MIKRILVVGILAISLVSCNNSKKEETKKETTTGGTEGSSLELRLKEYLALNQAMDFDGLMEYIHPRLFTLAPKEQMKSAMKDFFQSSEIKVKLDSLEIDSIYPVFEMESAQYAKVDYSMVMFMDFSPEDSLITDEDKDQNLFITSTMSDKYGKDNVSIDKVTGVIRVRTASPMVAIKDDKVKDWHFIGLREGDPMGEKLFSKEVRDKLDTYKK